MTAAFDVASFIIAEPWRRSVLEAVRHQQLPDWAVGAGFLRPAVWDALHGYREPTPLADVDVLYFDRGDLSRERETAIEVALTTAMAGVPWSVRNQARMHLRNGDRALCRHDGCTPVLVGNADRDRHSNGRARPIAAGAVRYCRSDRYGLSANAAREKLAQYRQRVAEKNWRARWPRVRVLDA